MTTKNVDQVKRLIFYWLLFPLIVFSLSSYTVLPIERIREKGIKVSHLPASYPTSIALTIKPAPNTELYYTVNGSFPDQKNTKWKSSVGLDTVTSLVIGLYRDGRSTDTFYVGTYLVNFKSALPITSIVIPRSDLFDSTNGIYVGGMTEDGKRFGNCWKNIEKKAFFEYFEKGNQFIAQGCGLKIFGGLTRQNSEKSLRVIARKKYGKGRFNHKMFPTKEISSFNSLVLRTSGNDFNATRFLDIMISSIAKDMGTDYLAYQPSVLFVNGEYWGIHNIREKTNTDYLYLNHGADENGTDLLYDNAIVEHGTGKRYAELKRLVSTLNPSSDHYIDSVSKYMDIENYFRYSILQIHIVNIDSRNNIRYWRSENIDNKFRWIYYDGDLSFANFNTDFLSKKISPIKTDWYNPEYSTILLRNLLKNSKLRNKFITAYCFYLSNIFQQDSLQKRIQSFKANILPEIERHLKRRNFNQSMNNWNSHVNRLMNFASKRESTAYLHLQNNFQLKSPYNLTVKNDLNKDLGIKVLINNDVITKFPYTGKYYRNIQFTITARSADPLYRFIKWSDGNTNQERIIKGDQNGDLILEPVFEKVASSPLKGDINVKLIGLKKWSDLNFIVVDANISKSDNEEVEFVDGEYSMIVKLEVKKGFTVVCNDSIRFRSEFPNHDYHVVQINTLDLRALQEKGFFLFDKNRKLIDIMLPSSKFNQIPFIIRASNDTFEPRASKPDLSELKEKNDLFGKTILISSFSLIGLILIALYKRFKKQ